MRVFNKKFKTIEDGMKIMETITRFSNSVEDEELKDICRAESLKIGEKLAKMGADRTKLKKLIIDCCK